MSVYSSSEIRNSAALEAEAEFGLCCIEQFCMTLRADSSVLEVGSGPGLLLSNLHKNFPNLKFEGIEPYTSGYQGTKSKSHCGKILIHNTHYEQFEAKNKFDLVFSINVFEHLHDWRDFINKAAIWLKPNGRFVVLCPNYSFPYGHTTVCLFSSTKRSLSDCLKSKLTNLMLKITPTPVGYTQLR